jgi:hypothetical protein
VTGRLADGAGVGTEIAVTAVDPPLFDSDGSAVGPDRDCHGLVRDRP